MTTTPKFVTLPWHLTADQLLRSARAGEESLFLVGPPGTGKTELVRQHADGHADASVDGHDRASDALHGTRGYLYVLLGRLNTPAVLMGAVLSAARQPLSARLRRKGNTYLMQYVADWLAKKNIGALVLDEVQHASADALFHAMLLRDVCAREHAHPLGLVLVGTPNATSIVRDTGQMGQRIPIEFAVPLLAPEEIASVCLVRPPMASLQRALGKRRWEALLHDVVTKASGSIRRLTDTLDRAERLANLTGERLSDAHVRAAIDAQVD